MVNWECKATNQSTPRTKAPHIQHLAAGQIPGKRLQSDRRGWNEQTDAARKVRIPLLVATPVL